MKEKVGVIGAGNIGFGICSNLLQAGFEPDYFAIRDASTLRAVTEDSEEIAILAAAQLGNTRLIDNVRLALNPVSDWGMLADGHQQ